MLKLNFRVDANLVLFAKVCVSPCAPAAMRLLASSLECELKIV